MDEADLAILKAMGARRCGPVGCLPSDVTPIGIARQVGMDRATVQARMQRMKEQGFLTGFELFPNLRLFDLAECVFFFDKVDPKQKADLFERLRLVDGLLEVHDFWRDTLCAVMSYRSEADRTRKAALLSEFVGHPGDLIFERQRPSLLAKMDLLDFQVLRSLRHDALKAPADIAAELGVSSKTVRRHMDKLARAQAYFLYPRLDPTKGDGFITAGFQIWFREARPQHADGVRRLMAAHRFFDEAAVTGDLYMVGGFQNPIQVSDMEERIATMPGVERVQAYVIQSARSYADWIDEAIDARIENLRTAT